MSAQSKELEITIYNTKNVLLFKNHLFPQTSDAELKNFFSSYGHVKPIQYYSTENSLYSLLFQTSDAELKNFFSAYGHVKETKIIADRAGVSKG